MLFANHVATEVGLQEPEDRPDEHGEAGGEPVLCGDGSFPQVLPGGDRISFQGCVPFLTASQLLYFQNVDNAPGNISVCCTGEDSRNPRGDVRRSVCCWERLKRSLRHT